MRTFDSFSQAENENGESRILVGFHFRNSDLVGVRLGQHVASWALRHYFQRTY